MFYHQLVHWFILHILHDYFGYNNDVSPIKTKEISLIHVDKVSSRFESFASGFISMSELAFGQVVLGAEFDFESNGDMFGIKYCT